MRVQYNHQDWRSETKLFKVVYRDRMSDSRRLILDARQALRRRFRLLPLQKWRPCAPQAYRPKWT
jgi:hypothetical protein